MDQLFIWLHSVVRTVNHKLNHLFVFFQLCLVLLLLLLFLLLLSSNVAADFFFFSNGRKVYLAGKRAIFPAFTAGVRRSDKGPRGQTCSYL